MRKELYQALKSRLKSLDSVKHVAMWNHNVEFIEQEMAWERPAVFVEFLPMEWRCVVPGREYHTRVCVRLHIVYDSCYLEHNDFDLSSDIASAVIGLGGNSFSPLEPLESATNHNHEEITEDIDTYFCESSMLLY